MTYVLIGQTPVPEPDPETWACAIEDQRRVAFTQVLNLCRVSTVFLGIDHRFGGMGPPVLFETMVFWAVDGPCEQTRCSTWAEAEVEHAVMVREVQRPAYVLAWIGRIFRATIRAAGDDLRERWRELRGIEATELEKLSASLRLRCRELLEES